MAQVQRSAEARKPLTVNKSAIVRKRVVAGNLPGADIPFVDRSAVMAHEEGKAPDPSTPLFPSRSEAVDASVARTEMDIPTRADTSKGRVDLRMGQRFASLLSLVPEPDLQRRLMLGAAAALLLVVSGVLALTVIGDRNTAQLATASVPEASPAPMPTQNPVAASAQTPPEEALARPAPESAPSVAPVIPAENDVVGQFAQTALAALRSPGASSVQPAAPDAAARMAENNPLYRMVAEAISQGQSDAYIDRLLNLAHQRGEITVPPGLIKPDGAVDTKTVIALFAGG
ncbi:hypothetical protein [Roseobacter sp. AzwK-3b]|uniref:hypothetical protein n=1 Tax=Roseobacter sp. AzwK-3b TaxID=351016 RepID=UPI00067FAB01|nr:hypothetical protein [Roseobacter sp. AzwK-3b]